MFDLILDGGALRADLEELSTIGRDPAGGITRTAFTPADREARDWAGRRMQASGMTVRVDPVGNLIGLYPGLDPALPPIVIGSHLDTVPQGGAFDGALGVLAGIACVRALARHNQRLRHPIEVVAFASEEAGIAGGTLGSRAMAGMLGRDFLNSPVAPGVTLSDRLREFGLEPEGLFQAFRPAGSMAAYLELHIEQGGVLDTSGVPLGLVEGIVGIRRYAVSFFGETNHAGTTPMSLRRDALVYASQFVLAVKEKVTATGDMVGTVGHLEVFPGAGNVIPGRVELALELRALSETALDSMEAELQTVAKAIAPRQFCRVSAKPPVACNPELLADLAAAAAQLKVEFMSIPSGAGHDAMVIAKLAPVAMLFVPSRGGLSHCPQEETDWEHCATGAGVLAKALELIDRRLDSRTETSDRRGEG